MLYSIAVSSALARSGLSTTIKYAIRSHSKISLAKATTSHSHSILSRSFQSTTQFQGQAGLAVAPVEEGYPINDVQGYGNVVADSDRSLVCDDYTVSLSEKSPPPRPRKPVVRIAYDLETQAAPAQIASVPSVLPYHIGRESKFERVPYWQNIPRWKDVSEKQWLDYSWGTAKNIQGKQKLYQFLTEVLPENFPPSEQYERIRSRDAFIQDVMEGIDAAPMSIRLTPHILSSINWDNPLEDPLRRQFIPMKTSLQPDHPMLTLDSLHETEDSPVEGLVHRYADKCLFLATSVCPLYCRYCTRSYAVGANTETVTKSSLKPKKARWEDMFDYIKKTPTIHDVVVSGGDSYLLTPAQVRLIGTTLLNTPHIRRIRFASKGLCVSPSRTLDPNDDWTDALVEVVKLGRTLGKHVALHTHFNHANEFSWVTREAAQRFCREGVTVRNQSVLLRGVNDTKEAMVDLIRELADCGIIPYYVYQHDLVAGVEDLRTPLSTILSLESSFRGSIAGFMTPQFVVDLPGGGGKRLAASYQSYDRETGKSTFTAPAVKGGEGIYEYWDPVESLEREGREKVLGMHKAN